MNAIFEPLFHWSEMSQFRKAGQKHLCVLLSWVDQRWSVADKASQEYGINCIQLALESQAFISSNCPDSNIKSVRAAWSAEVCRNLPGKYSGFVENLHQNLVVKSFRVTCVYNSLIRLRPTVIMKHDDLPKSDLLSVSDFGPADAKASFLHPAPMCTKKRKRSWL